MIINRAKAVFKIFLGSRTKETFVSKLDESTFNRLRKDVQKIFIEQSENVGATVDGDTRLWGIQKYNPEVFRNVLENVVKNSRRYDLLDLEYFVMYNRISNSTNGSGGGWHRDGFPREYKVLVYLTDVEIEENGAFQYVKNSNSFKSKIFDSVSRFFLPNWTRYENVTSNKIQTITGKKGTYFIVDTSGMHRGSPVLKGQREAITYYLYENLPEKFLKYK